MVKIEIEIPDPPEGWEFAGARIIKNGERYLFNGAWVLWESVPSSFPVLVCVKSKPLWEPPFSLLRMLRPGWVTRDRNGFCSWHKSKPTLNGLFGWCSNSMQSLMALESNHLPPEEIPWDQCCFKIGEPE